MPETTTQFNPAGAEIICHLGEDIEISTSDRQYFDWHAAEYDPIILTDEEAAKKNAQETLDLFEYMPEKLVLEGLSIGVLERIMKKISGSEGYDAQHAQAWVEFAEQTTALAVGDLMARLESRKLQDLMVDEFDGEGKFTYARVLRKLAEKVAQDWTNKRIRNG